MAEMRLQIKPEFAEDLLSGFADKFAGALSSGSPKGGSSDKKESGGGGLGGLGGIAKMAGLGALAGGGAFAGITLLLESFKPLVSMVKQIGTILMQFLRPIAEFVMFLLQPLVMLLRPLLVTFNALFAPFRRAAQQLSVESTMAFQQGDEARGFALAGLSAATILKPISDIMLDLQSGILKLGVEAIGLLLKGSVTILTGAVSMLAGIFSDQVSLRIAALGGAATGLIDHQVDAVKMGIDAGVTLLKNAGSEAIMNMASDLGVNVILPMLSAPDGNSIFAFAKEGFMAFGEAAKKIVDTQFDEEEGFIGAFTSGMDTFGRKATEKTARIFKDLNDAVSRADGIIKSLEKRVDRMNRESESDVYRPPSGTYGDNVSVVPRGSQSDSGSSLIRNRGILGAFK